MNDRHYVHYMIELNIATQYAIELQFSLISYSKITGHYISCEGIENVFFS